MELANERVLFTNEASLVDTHLPLLVKDKYDSVRVAVEIINLEVSITGAGSGLDSVCLHCATDTRGNRKNLEARKRLENAACSQQTVQALFAHYLAR